MADAPPRLFHASPSANRDSIRAHGLDITRMSLVGIAGSPDAETDGVFLANSIWDGFWYASFGKHERVDIWQVEAAGLQLDEDNEGWICRQVIPTECLTLIEKDVSPEAADAWLDASEQTWVPPEPGEE